MIELLPSGKSEGYEVCADDVALAVISPVAARNRAQAGVGCQGGFAPPYAAALPLTACPGCAFSPASDGGISSRAAPFSKIGKGRGKKVDPLHYKNYKNGGFQNETTPCVYHRRVERRSL